MNDYCLNQSWGLKGRQHTSTHLFHWVSLLQNKLSFTPGYYFIFLFCKIIMVYYLSQKQTNISFYMYALVTPEISHEIEGAVSLEDSDNQIPSSQGGGGCWSDYFDRYITFAWIARHAICICPI